MPEEVRRAADLLERRWTLSILYASIDGAERFNEFLDALGRVPPATLAARLNELVEAGLLDRRVLDTRPPAVEYRLTGEGDDSSRWCASSCAAHVDPYGNVLPLRGRSARSGRPTRRCGAPTCGASARCSRPTAAGSARSCS